MRDRHLQALAGIVVLAAALRFPTLDAQSYWVDEAVTATLLDQGLGDMLADVPDSESTPPLYYALAWLWSKLFGLGEAGLRSLSALVGTAAAVAAYAGGRALVSSRAGLAAAALVATNPLLVWYSQEARAYSLLVLFAALSIPLAARAERAAGRALAGWGAVCALALATHYFAVFVVVPQALWLLWRRRDRITAAAVALPGAAGIALLPLAVGQAENQGANFIETDALGFRLAQVPKQMLVGFDAPAEVAIGIAAGLLALAGGWLLVTALAAEERRGALTAAGLAAAAIGVPVALAATGIDYLITRNLIAALPALLIALGAGFASRRAGVAAAAALCALSALVVVWVAAEPRYQRDDWRGAAEALGPALADRVIVVTPSEGGVALRPYLPGIEPLQPEGATVASEGVIGIGRRVSGQAPTPPRPEAPVAPPNLPELARRVEETTFTVLVWSAPGPVFLNQGGAETAKLVPEPAAVLLQRAKSEAR
ncbi:MAG TPA: glycosyltransferase family 39 protein [Thermoleophilaceae bacterium]|nr:glycosyltransferase family 39 protein [Thermoleophilaceae bacterium]